MPTPAERPAVLRGRVFRGSTVVAGGLLTRKQLRSSAWVRLRRDVYADAALPVTHRLLISAVGLCLPAGAGFTGRSAAVLWGMPELAEVTDPVDVALPVDTRWHPGGGVRARPVLPGQEFVRRGRWPITSRVDTAVDLLRWADGDDGVVLLDQLVDAGLVQLAEVRRAVAGLPRCRGSARARRVAASADGGAESPQETRLRLLLLRGGLPAPIAQFRVFDADGFVARVDLAYPDLKIAIEYDGLWHGGRTAFLDDRRRLNRLLAAGWVVLHVTTDDMRRPALLVERVVALRAQRRHGTRTR